jgi:hypothetical protein
LVKRFAGVTAAIAFVFCASDASALSQRTFVSKNGSNGNPCSVTAPCRSISTAIARTLAGGEVVVLDCAGYGAFSIERTTVADSSGDGIVVLGTFPPRSVVHVSSSTISGNGAGVHADSGGFFRVMSTRINGNATGVSVTGSGVVETLQNNMCYGNGASCAFTGSLPLN